jgi:hypothetical protein
MWKVIYPYKTFNSVKSSFNNIFYLRTARYIQNQSRDSSVGIALGYGLDDWGTRVRFPTRTGNFSLHHRVQNGSGPTQPPIQCVPGALSLGIKRPGREAYHSPPSSAEDKESVELYLHSPATPSWHGAQLKHRDFYLYLLHTKKEVNMLGCLSTCHYTNIDHWLHEAQYFLRGYKARPLRSPKPISVLTLARYSALRCANWIKFTHFHPFLKI